MSVTGILVAVTLLLPSSAKAIILVGTQQNISTATLPLESQAAICSATLVGPKAVLTAASCLEGDSTAEVRTPDGNTYQLSGCEFVPQFKQDRTYDLELCYSATPIPLLPERINIDSDSFRIGDTAYLAGLGCTESGGPDTKFGKLSTGPATLVDIFNDPSGLVLVGSALCPGDAGGGTFVSTTGGWKLIGVNSRSDRDVRSFVSPTNIRIFVDWAKKWSADHVAPICGLDAENGCAAATPVMSNSSAAEAKTLRMMLVQARAGDTTPAVVVRACGEDQSGSYYKALEEYYKTYSSNAGSANTNEAGIDANTLFGFNREISIPVCASNPSRLEKRIVNKGETAWSIWQATKERAKAKGSPVLDFRRDGNDVPGLDSLYFIDVFIALNKDNKDFKIERLPEGRNVFIPLAPLVNRAVTGTRVAQPLISAIFSDDSQPRPIFAVKTVNPSCDQNAGGSDYPYDLNALLDVLRNNLPGKRSPVPVKVLVADTGVAGPKSNGFFSDEMLMAAAETLGIAPRFRSSIEGYNHGTEVASVVAGGPTFARIQGLGLPRIRLVVLPIYVTERSLVLSDKVRALNNWAMLVHDAAKDLEIVNLSLEVQGQLQATDIFSQKELLFVVAAGNDYASLFEKEIYPAKLGGDGVNIVTVAAVYRSKSGDGTVEIKLPDFSNYWADFVDIGAPGCGVPSIAFEENAWKEVNPDGTSFAAPLVSFAAALIKSEARERGLTPLEIKRRLLASSDLNPLQAQRIRDGRVLNLVKAVSLYRDIVQTKDGKILSGSLQYIDSNGDELNTLSFGCDDGPLNVQAQKILKVWPSFTGSDKAKVYMLGGPQQVMLAKSCSLPAGVRIKLTDDGKQDLGGSPFKLEELRDVVRRLF